MGQEVGLPSHLPSSEETRFPGLHSGNYRVTSPQDTRYNCIAHANGDSSKKWDCPGFPHPGYYWPTGAVKGQGIEALESCFQSQGYERCDNGEAESGFEKVALYADNNCEWTHAAKLEQNGKWSSKLGSSHDIMHHSAHCFGGSEYGDVLYFMKRPTPTQEQV